jgi:hypothetical protein
MNSDGLKSAQVSPPTGKTRAPAPSLVTLRKGPYRFEQPEKRLRHYSCVSLTFA